MSPGEACHRSRQRDFHRLDGVALLRRLHPIGSNICLIGGRPRSADPPIADMQRYFSNATNYFNDETTRPATGSRRRLPKWVKTGKWRGLSGMSGLLPRADIARPPRHVRKVPEPD